MTSRLFLFSALKNNFILREAYNFRIPCIAIVDTNVSSQGITLPIPGNDDSFEAILFFGEIISHQILFVKLSTIHHWFSNIRLSKRFINFSNWVATFNEQSENKLNVVPILYLYEPLKSFSHLLPLIIAPKSLPNFQYSLYLSKFILSISSFSTKIRNYLQLGIRLRKKFLKIFSSIFFFIKFLCTRIGSKIFKYLFVNLTLSPFINFCLINFIKIYSINSICLSNLNFQKFYLNLFITTFIYNNLFSIRKKKI